VITGDVGVMTGFMMQKGALIIGGNAGEALGDSLYEGKIYLRGEADSLGADAQIVPLNARDTDFLATTFLEAGLDFQPEEFKKVESARRLYNFDTKEKEIWKQAL
jgi:glutamate synthase domain-containing protein 3